MFSTRIGHVWRGMVCEWNPNVEIVHKLQFIVETSGRVENMLQKKSSYCVDVYKICDKYCARFL